ncbi:MAG: group II intron reverse transcriptase/maturase [Rehaibacterium terrae]|uniref:group II intron reverse transcriptase/maturase n=1 Tax=Rehaibacterium terrae TaxID=1341696 RepID=UPI003919F3A6
MHQKPGRPGPKTHEGGEAAGGRRGGEARPAGHEETDSGRADLLRQALGRDNMQRAWQRVRRNGGSAGVDGRSIADTKVYLREHWPRIREELLSGTYRPSPVRRVAIPKPGGGERELGIPTVVDRLIQQALLQVLQPLIDPTFSEHSYGFRPGRRAHDAILQAQAHIEAGYRIVVDVDLEKFFDRVNHDVLMDRLSKRIADRAVLRLIRRYLDAGMMADGVVIERQAGTPQGGPLSPLLANVLLDEVDRELERRGHRFVRYADDCNVYVRSRAAGERVMAGLRRLYGRLRLRINETKSAVASVFERSFLGYAFGRLPNAGVRRKVAPKALARLKDRLRQLTRRTRGRSIEQVVEELRAYLLGWKAYFRLARMPHVFGELDEWLRHRLRMLHLVQWKRGRTAYPASIALGASPVVAGTIAANLRRWWRNSALLLNTVLPIAYFDRLGVPRLS